MKRWLYSYRSVPGDPAGLAGRLRGDLRGLLAAGTASTPPVPAGDGSFRIQLPVQVLGAELTKAVRVRTGVATVRGTRLVIPLTWQADPTRHAFPTFSGAIELAPLDRSSAQLTIVGSYVVPAGVVGLLADSTVLRGVAERTAERILDGLAGALTAPTAQEQVPPAVAPSAPSAPMRVADVMTPDPLVLEDGQPLRTAALLLFHAGISGAPVVDADGALVGVLSEADLMEKEAPPVTGLGRGATKSWRMRGAMTVGEACSRPARVTAADATLRDAVRELIDHGVARLAVVDGGRIAGILSRHDVLAALIRTDEVIKRTADAVLQRQDEPDVTVTVEWGAVTLDGAATRRSRIRGLIAQVEAIDGVMGVDADRLGYHEDDVVPVAMPFV